jgi:prepilin-type N-terminal cleavage/methylation domain-containing protein
MHLTISKLHPRGYSLPEIMVTIAIVAILAAISLVSYGNVSESARLVLAQNIVAHLNAGVKGFGQGSWDIHTAKDDSSITDEFKVLRTLQYKAPTSSGRFDTGAPYYPPTWNPGESSSTTDYRAQWNGVNFQLLTPGTSGTGFKLKFDGSDQNSDYTFPANFTPEPPANSN